jgi:hypothetical protein
MLRMRLRLLAPASVCLRRSFRWLPTVAAPVLNFSVYFSDCTDAVWRVKIYLTFVR